METSEKWEPNPRRVPGLGNATRSIRNSVPAESHKVRYSRYTFSAHFQVTLCFQTQVRYVFPSFAFVLPSSNHLISVGVPFPSIAILVKDFGLVYSFDITRVRALITFLVNLDRSQWDTRGRYNHSSSFPAAKLSVAINLRPRQIVRLKKLNIEGRESCWRVYSYIYIRLKLSRTWFFSLTKLVFHRTKNTKLFSSHLSLFTARFTLRAKRAS